MLVPGIDVPFHSTLLRKGVPEFRDKLDALLPAYIDYRGRLGGPPTSRTWWPLRSR